MKIIAPGKNQADWRETVTCKETHGSGCNAVFEIGREDAFIERWQHTDLVTCLCPCCGTQVRVCGAKPFLTDLPAFTQFKAAHPEIAAKAASDEAASTSAWRAHPPHDGMGRGY